jgi:hypothetical protein
VDEKGAWNFRTQNVRESESAVHFVLKAYVECAAHSFPRAVLSACLDGQWSTQQPCNGNSGSRGPYLAGLVGADNILLQLSSLLHGPRRACPIDHSRDVGREVARNAHHRVQHARCKWAVNEILLPAAKNKALIIVHSKHTVALVYSRDGPLHAPDIGRGI